VAKSVFFQKGPGSEADIGFRAKTGLALSVLGQYLQGMFRSYGYSGLRNLWVGIPEGFCWGRIQATPRCLKR